MNRLVVPGGPSTQIRYAVVELAKLRGHERTQEPLLRKLVDRIRADGFLRRPVLVEAEHFVILDGHHRVEALRLLGCARVPVYLVDYGDPAIGVTTWPGAIIATVTKEEIVDRGLRGNPFPPKTTRHIVSFTLEDVRVQLDDLR